jgi:hypothetical protein
MENNMEVSGKSKIGLIKDATIPLLVCTQSTCMLDVRDICTPMFIGALFTITKI